MMFDPTQNLIDAARRIAAELSSDSPEVVARLLRRRHILAAGLRVHAANLETYRAAQAKQEAA